MTSVAARVHSPERGPAALMPAPAARLVGFAALACLGVGQWQRMVAALSFGRPLLWVLLAVAAAGAVLASERAPARLRSAALLGAAAGGLAAAYFASGLDAGLLKPRRWDELGSGVVSGAQALSTVRLPYEGADPWPGLVLQLLGATLVMVSALLAFWPRGAGGGRGYPFLALAALLVLAAAPVVSLGGTRPLLLGAALTLLTVCFLWLERLPLRPGLGVAALVGLSLAGALPLAAAADRGEPWFDYQTFAEGLGPKDPLSFDWDHGDYGPITWTRTGAEVLRIKAARPHYWKARTLDEFDGYRWAARGYDRASDDPTDDLPAGWDTQARNEDRLDVSVQRLRGSDVVGAGTTLRVSNATREVQRGMAPGQWVSVGDLRASDSYRADVFVPRPTQEQLADLPATPNTQHAEDLDIRVRLRTPTAREAARLPSDGPGPGDPGGSAPESAVVRFPPFGRGGPPEAAFGDLGIAGSGALALRLSGLERIWRLAEQLKRGSQTPYDYVLAVNGYLHKGFTYTERPPAPAPGVSPLESFLFDTKAGYCQHYSAAMALLLVMGGIPARVATGFSPGGYSKRKGAWIVRDTDAHSWVEAWFDLYGWVTLDPTPPATPARSQIAAITAPPPSSADGGADGGGSGAVAGADRGGRGPRGKVLRGSGGGAMPGTADELDPQRSGGLPAWLLVPVLLAIGAGGGFVVARRRRGRPSDPLDRAILELETALRRAGHAAPAGMTLRQLERRLALSGEAAGYLRAISAARYTARPVMPTNAQRRALRRELAGGRGLRGRLRTFWALPPRAR